LIEVTVEFMKTHMKRRTSVDLYLGEQLKDADAARRVRRPAETWDVAIQLASLRKKSGLSQKELAQRVGTSQQQISRLESPSYGGHSLSMLRRVAEVLGATVHVAIRGKKHQVPTVGVDTAPIGRVRSKDLRERSEVLKFELDFLREEKADITRNFHIVDALYNEAVTLGIIPLRNPLDGIQVDLKIAKVVNSV